jgi:colicin import membrane protein
MNPSQRKYLVFSVIMHAGLLSLLIVGPAFMPETKPPVNDLKLLEFIPANLIDAPFSGGGVGGPPNPEPKQPKASQAKQENVTPPPKITQKEEKTPPVEKTPEKPRAEEVKTPPKKEVIEKDEGNIDPVPQKNKRTAVTLADLRPVKNIAKAETSKSGSGDKRNTDTADKQRRALEGALGNLQKTLSAGSGIESFSFGDGGDGTGGPAYANYDQAIRSLFYNAWDPPSEVEDNGQSVIAEVSIHRSGKVVSSRIIQSSGNAAIDKSVRRALDRIDEVPPFPSTSKDQHRGYRILFNLSIKLRL